MSKKTEKTFEIENEDGYVFYLHRTLAGKNAKPHFIYYFSKEEDDSCDLPRGYEVAYPRKSEKAQNQNITKCPILKKIKRENTSLKSTEKPY